MTMEKLILMQHALNEPKLLLALKRPANKFFYDTVKRYAEGNRNLILSFWGATGSGKSVASFYLAYLWSKYAKVKFSADNIAFTNQEALEMLSVAKDGQVIIVDEQIETFGPGSGREDAALQNIETTVRQSQISLFYNSPKPKLHANHFMLWVTNFLSHYVPLTPKNFEHDWKSLQKENLTKLSNLCILYEDEKLPLGYISTYFPSMKALDKKFWQAYFDRKQSFIKAVLRQEPIDRTKDYEKIADDFVNEAIRKKEMKFGSKSELLTVLQQKYKKNYAREEWVSIRHLIDQKCREQGLNPYSFANKDNW